MTKEQLAKLGITIEGDSISDDEAFALIEKHTKALSDEKSKLKKRNDELSSENADYKRKAQDQLSEEEKTTLKIQELENSNKELKRSLARNDLINELVGIGYDKELATKYADAQLDGKPTIEFQKKFMESKLEAQKQELLKGGKDPKIDDPDKAKTKFTKENFSKGLISMEEMNTLKETNPTLYSELIK